MIACICFIAGCGKGNDTQQTDTDIQQLTDRQLSLKQKAAIDEWNRRNAERDREAGFEQLKKIAGQGDVNAQNLLGRMYYEGLSVPKNDAEAFKWFQKAAAQGDKVAKEYMAKIKGTTDAGNTGVKAAAPDDAEAQYKRGGLYYSGQGVAKDYGEAMKWYHKAADQGHAGAQFMLGVLYFNGQGVTQDTAEALKWLRKSAAQGDANAKAFLEQTGLPQQ